MYDEYQSRRVEHGIDGAVEAGCFEACATSVRSWQEYR